MVTKRLKPIGLAVMAFSFALMISTPLTGAQAISNQWSVTSPTIPSGDMMRITNVSHNGNYLIKEITIPHIRVWYLQDNDCPLCLKINDDPGYPFNDGNPELLTTYDPTESIWQVIFYYECSKEDWASNSVLTYGCYKYKQFYTLDDGDANQSPRFRVTLQAFGPGFGPNPWGRESNGYPTYYPEWRIDVNMPGGSPSSTNDYARQKQVGGTSIDLTQYENPPNYEGRYNNLIGAGQPWRTNDLATTWTKALAFDPITPSGSGEWVSLTRYSASERDPSDTFTYGGQVYGMFAYENFAVPAQSMPYTDIVIWLVNWRTADSANCVIGHPCKMETNLIPTGGW